jgi:aminopeptidase N
MQTKELNQTDRNAPQWDWITFVFVVLVLISAGCGSEASEEIISDPTQTGIINPATQPPHVDFHSSVLENCDLASQEAAMSPEQIPDWNDIPINACYKLWLNLGDDPREYEGNAQITYTNQTDEILNDLVFRTYPNAERVYGGMLEVTSARVGGNPVQPISFLPDNTGLRLVPDDPVLPGDTVVIDLEFTGRLTDGLQGSPGTYGLYTYSQGEDVATYINWYPILAVWEGGHWQAEPVIGIGDSVVSEVGLYLVKITAPNEIQVVTGGSIIEQVSENDLEVYTIASGPVRDFPIVASPNFILALTEADGISINHWGLPGGEERWEEALQTTVDSLTVFNELFGPYPYRELDIVSVPLQLASGVEYPGLFLMKDELYHVDHERSFLLPTIIAHEIAHQWWYGLVGNNVLDDPWQDEALTTYSSLLYLEQYQPQVYQGTVDFFNQDADHVNNELTNSDIGQSVNAFIDKPEFYSPVVYSKGGIFFLELRERIGDRAFFKALQDYFSIYLYRVAPPDRLLEAFENSCECELDDFYAQWGVE